MAPLKAPAVKLKYTNRKSDGPKLAAIVAKDLRKHATAFDKKKSPTDNDSASLELDLENKQQTDDCVREYAPVLLDALTLRHGISPLRLEELCLRGNTLTVESLRLLAPVIRSAHAHLHDVDFSQNNIKVSTLEEAEAFDVFLRAFGQCSRLRRLDLSENDLSGPLAMEVLLRVYCDQAPIDTSLLYDLGESSEGDESIGDVAEKTNGNGISPRVRRDSTTSGTMHNEITVISPIYRPPRNRGLRSIPYILLKNSKMDDAGALHLAYVLRSHYWPQYLMPRLKDGSKEAKRRDEDDAGGYFGVIYSGNAGLSPYGLKWLDIADQSRARLAGHAGGPEASQDAWGEGDGHLSARSRKLSVRDGSDDTHDKKAFSPSITTPSLRMRMQRMALENGMMKRTHLWHAAFKVLFAARVILPKASAATETPSRPAAQRITTPDGHVVNTENAGLQSHEWPALAKLAPPRPQDRKPMRLSLSVRTNGATNTSGSVEPSMDAATKSGNDMVGNHKGRMTKAFTRDPSNAGELTLKIWTKIFVEYADAEGVLNEEQLSSIVAYARDRDNLAGEQQTQVKGESHQLWHILDQIGCWTYALKID